jgi:hypothetical protein
MLPMNDAGGKIAWQRVLLLVQPRIRQDSGRRKEAAERREGGLIEVQWNLL